MEGSRLFIYFIFLRRYLGGSGCCGSSAYKSLIFMSFKPVFLSTHSRVEQLAAEMREDIADENGSMNSEEMEDDDAG